MGKLAIKKEPYANGIGFRVIVLQTRVAIARNFLDFELHVEKFIGQIGVFGSI